MTTTLDYSKGCIVCGLRHPTICSNDPAMPRAVWTNMNTRCWRLWLTLPDSMRLSLVKRALGRRTVTGDVVNIATKRRRLPKRTPGARTPEFTTPPVSEALRVEPTARMRARLRTPSFSNAAV